MNQVWAVIPTNSRSDMALRAVHSVLAQSEAPAGVVVVDDCGPSRIADLVHERFGDGVHALRLERNVGPAGSFAAGIAEAVNLGAGWLWLLDDDAHALPDALERLLASARLRQSGLAALCSVKQSPNGNVQSWEKRARPGRTGTGIGMRAGPRTFAPVPLADYERDEFEADAVPFAGMLVSAAVLARAGLPDARYFSWFADYEWSFRLRQCGSIFCVPSSRLVHEDESSHGTHIVAGRERPSLAAFERQCVGLRNRTYYFFRNGGRARTALAAAWRFGRMSAGILLFDSDKRLRLAHLARAFADGFRGRLGPLPLKRGAASG